MSILCICLRKGDVQSIIAACNFDVLGPLFTSLHVLSCPCVFVFSFKDGGGDTGSGMGKRSQNEKYQDKKGKAICKYYMENRCTWVSQKQYLLLFNLLLII